jgi:hypothetical protein
MMTVFYQRRDDVLWRSGADRVVARRIGAPGVDLLGATALVWVALDDRRSHSELVGDLGELGVGADVLDAALDELRHHMLIMVV